MVELPYGRVPYPLDLPGRDISVLLPPSPPPPTDLRVVLDAALDAPIGRRRLETLVSPGARVTLIVSDATRTEPRAGLISAIRRRLPPVRWTLAIATGTHGPADLDTLALPDDLRAEATIINHDGHRDDDLLDIGTTAHGTPVQIHRCVVEADLVIATGCIRPHYFAGFGAGVKAIFPGLGSARSIRINHALKTDPRSRAGVVDRNPCRDDLEAAFRLVPTPAFLLNGVCAGDGVVHAAVAGDPVGAFRAGAELARSWFTATSARAPLVVASDGPPVTATLYQAAKIAAAAAHVVAEGGALVIVADCSDGIGPLAVVNEAIFRIGVLPRLPARASLHLVSSLSDASVATTLVQHAPSVASIAATMPGPVLVIPRASQLLIDVLP